MSTSIPHGVSVTLKANQVYALPSELTFVTAAGAVETSLNGTAWTVLTGATTGAVTGAVFIRAAVDTLLVAKEATNAINVPGSAMTDMLSLNERELVDLKGVTIVGTVANIKDSKTDNPGQIVIGGGTNSVLARYNGKNWIVII